MREVPVFVTRRDARRFLSGIAMLLAGLLMMIPTWVRGPSHVLDFYWFYQGGFILFLAAGLIGSGPVKRAVEAFTKRENVMDSDKHLEAGKTARATIALYSRRGWREAVRVARSKPERNKRAAG